MDKNRYKPEMVQILCVILNGVKQGVYEDPSSVHMHHNFGIDEVPKYITARSTSQLENFHRTMRLPLEVCISIEMMDLLYADYCFHWSMNKAINIRGVKLLPVSNPLLLNDNLLLLTKLGVSEPSKPKFIKAWIPIVTSNPTKSKPIRFKNETLGVLRFQYCYEAFQTSQKLTTSLNEKKNEDITQPGNASLTIQNDLYIIEPCTPDSVQEPYDVNFILSKGWVNRNLGIIKKATFITTHAEKALFYVVAIQFVKLGNNFSTVDASAMAIY